MRVRLVWDASEIEPSDRRGAGGGVETTLRFLLGFALLTLCSVLAQADDVHHNIIIATAPTHPWTHDTLRTCDPGIHGRDRYAARMIDTTAGCCLPSWGSTARPSAGAPRGIGVDRSSRVVAALEKYRAGTRHSVGGDGSTMVAVCRPMIAAPLVIDASASVAAPDPVAFCRMVETPDAFDGKLVRTTVILSVGPEERAIWDDECGGRKNAAWIDPIAGLGVDTSPKIRRRVTKRLDHDRLAIVTILGRFRAPRKVEVPPGVGDAVGKAIGDWGSRYGHEKGYQFLFEVTAIERVARVPSRRAGGRAASTGDP